LSATLRPRVFGGPNAERFNLEGRCSDSGNPPSDDPELRTQPCRAFAIAADAGSPMARFLCSPAAIEPRSDGQRNRNALTLHQV